MQRGERRQLVGGNAPAEARSVVVVDVRHHRRRLDGGGGAASSSTISASARAANTLAVPASEGRARAAARAWPSAALASVSIVASARARSANGSITSGGAVHPQASGARDADVVGGERGAEAGRARELVLADAL